MEKKRFNSCCFTGYRPQKFPFSLSEENPELCELIHSLEVCIYKLIKMGCRTFYSGMAMGFDILAAEAVLKLREHFPEVQLVCALPFPTQSSRYDQAWKTRYHRILTECDSVVTVCDSYRSDCFQQRNKYMVDHCDCVLTWYNGKPSGTRNTLVYAKRLGKTLVNINRSQEFV